MIIILGTPGAGKTTQTYILANYLACPWFSMGELIRQKSSGKDRAEMLAGKIIDDKATLEIVDKALEGIDTTEKECVFEGNPRSIAQAQWWLDQEKSGRFKLKGVIHLVAKPEVAKKRMIKRGRLDDHNANVIETRFEEYHRSITPTLNFLKENGVQVQEVDANGNIEQVAAAIRGALDIS